MSPTPRRRAKASRPAVLPARKPAARVRDEPSTFRVPRSPEDWRDFFAANQRIIYGAIREAGVSRSDPLADDIAQEVRIALLNKIEGIDPQRSPENFIYRIALHKAIDVIRREGRQRRLKRKYTRRTDGNLPSSSTRIKPARSRVVKGHTPIDPDSPFERIARREDRKNVQRVMDRLNIEDRMLLDRRHVHGQTHEEIARALGVGVEAVKFRITRAETRFRKAHQQLMDDLVFNRRKIA